MEFVRYVAPLPKAQNNPCYNFGEKDMIEPGLSQDWICNALKLSSVTTKFYNIKLFDDIGHIWSHHNQIHTHDNWVGSFS